MKYFFNIIILLFFIISIFVSINLTAQTLGWNIINSPTTNNLYGVSYIDQNTWIAVGDNGSIIRSSDGGSSWTNISSPVTDALRSVSFKGNIGIAVGISGRILRSTDSGLSWSLEQRITTRNLYAVSMGKYNSVIGGHEGTIFYSTDEGVSWHATGAGTASTIFGLSVLDSVAVGACGQGAVIMSINAGAAWGLSIFGTNLTFFNGVSFVNNKTGWMVGTSSTISSIILRSDQSGFVWSLQTSPTANGLNSVSFTSVDSGTAVGANGTIIHTTNGGLEWLSQVSGVSVNLNSVSFINSNLGIAVGDSGKILRTENSGIVSVGKEVSSPKPNSFSLEQNYPNPFNPTTVINYYLPEFSKVELKIYDILGREAITLINEEKPAGSYQVKFDGSRFASGIYFYRLAAGEYIASKKMVLVK